MFRGEFDYIYALVLDLAKDDTRKFLTKESEMPSEDRQEELSTRLLLVEDEPHLASGIKLNFELEGYEVDLAQTAKEAQGFLAGGATYGALILDVMLPDMDGFDLCEQIRMEGNRLPVIMLTAKNSADDRVRGLEAGADDYIVKPFDLRELFARIKSQLRRQDWSLSPEGNSNASIDSHAHLDSGPQKNDFQFGEVIVDFRAHEASLRGKTIGLTRLESDLLRFFLENENRILSREELLEKVWKLRNYPNTRTVDNFVRRMRKYFEIEPAKPKHFLSVRGFGYKFSYGQPEAD